MLLSACSGILSLNPLCGVLVLVQGTGRDLLPVTPKALPLHWADVHKWNLTHWSQVLGVWGSEGRTLEERMSVIRMPVCKDSKVISPATSANTSNYRSNKGEFEQSHPQVLLPGMPSAPSWFLQGSVFSLRVPRKKQLCIYGHGHVFISWEKITEIRSETLEK